MSKQQTGLIRHGDVLLKPIANLPSYHTLTRATAPVVIARGEATGHAHLLEGEVEADRLDREPTYVWVHGKAVLVHKKEGQLTGEHKTVEVPEGLYQVVQQREFWGPGHERLVRD